MIGGSETYLGGLSHSSGSVVLNFTTPRRSTHSVLAIGSLSKLKNKENYHLWRVFDKVFSGVWRPEMGEGGGEQRAERHKKGL